MPPPKLRLIAATLHRTPTRTRMPFRFGIAVMTEAPHVFLHGTFEIEGRLSTGVAAEGLLPKWFDKTPDKEPEQELSELLLVIRKAVTFSQEIPATTAFDFWQELYARQMPWARDNGLPSLLAHFGVSLVERAALDALARAKRMNLSFLLRENIAGIDLGAIHPQLAGRAPREFLPTRPLEQIEARHTVGLSDPLTPADIVPAEKLADGLPQSLEDCIRFYGLRHFKLKVRGDVEWDLERLRETADVIGRLKGRDFAFTLDGNEQYKEFRTFEQLWERIQNDNTLVAFFQNLLFIEQPLHRSVALNPAVAKIREWKGGPPMIIDESDAETGDLGRALDLGYAGTSHKNCKGVIKGVIHRCLLNLRNQTGGNRRHVMSGEDLVNIGPVALLQDLAVQAALGNDTVERNGHHYFKGLSAFPPHVNEAMLTHHGDVYTVLSSEEDARIARLNVRDGRICLSSINAAPFGVGADVSLSMKDFEQLPL